jgi:hypothetical protein
MSRSAKGTVGAPGKNVRLVLNAVGILAFQGGEDVKQHYENI